MRLLAIDTSTRLASVAVVVDGGTRTAERLATADRGHRSADLLMLIDAACRELAVAPRELDAIAVGAGPGSFTGLRIGLATAKGIAFAAGRPLWAVSSLAALAARALAEDPSGDVVAVLDARRGEVFGAVYNASARLVSPEVVAPFARWTETLPADELEFVSLDFAPFRAALAGTRFEQVPVRTAPRALAAVVARLAAQAELQDPAALDANYVRRSDAELLWKE